MAAGKRSGDLAFVFVYDVTTVVITKCQTLVGYLHHTYSSSAGFEMRWLYVLVMGHIKASMLCKCLSFW